MNMKKKLSLLLFIISFSAKCIYAETNLNSSETSREDTFNIKDKSFLLPLPQASGHYSSSLILLNVFVPKDWTLDMIKAPMIAYAGKYSLPKGFNVQASLSTIFVSNRVTLGPFWNYSINNCHLGVGYQLVYNYGVLKQFGYHTTLTGWEQQPTVLVGYSFQTMALTLRGDMYLTSELNLNEGGNTVSFDQSYLNGYSISLNLEQRITKNKVMSLGFKYSYLRYHILAWPAFPVNAYRYGVPEVQLGINF
jgi:hypothetical protein